MSVEILGGFAKGLIVKTPKGDLVRPTAVLLKRKIFDSWQNLEGFVFVDLCAGSGAIGLEASSRGAMKVIFIEKENVVFKTLSDNLQRFHEKYPTISLDIKKHDWKIWLSGFKDQYIGWENTKKENTILYFDPPYEQIKEYDLLVEKVMDDSWFRGFIWVESDFQKGVPLTFFSKFKEKNIKNFEQGSRYIAIFSF